jgi:hypothetical protein
MTPSENAAIRSTDGGPFCMLLFCPRLTFRPHNAVLISYCWIFGNPEETTSVLAKTDAYSLIPSSR